MDRDPLTRRRRLAVRAHLLEMTGDVRAAAAAYRRAAGLTADRVEERYLRDRARRISAAGP
jgi:predicted RNA polymerase sigma factor